MKKETVLAILFIVAIIASVSLPTYFICSRPKVKIQLINVDSDKELVMVNAFQYYKEKIIEYNQYVIPMCSIDSLKETEKSDLKKKVELFKQLKNCK